MTLCVELPWRTGPQTQKAALFDE